MNGSPPKDTMLMKGGRCKGENWLQIFEILQEAQLIHGTEISSVASYMER